MPNIDAKPLATKLYRCQYHGSIVLRIQFCVFIVFAIYPKLLNIFYLYSVAYIPQEYLPFTFNPFHHGPYQDLYHQDSFAESYRNERPYDVKKPAAKPTKGRPKKVAPKARKPRKSRTVPAVNANELVDPMANIHFGDDAIGVVTAGGGIARAGGYDPASSRKSGTT